MSTVLQSSGLIEALRASGRFASVESINDEIRCRAPEVDADYVLAEGDQGLVVRFETPDRWLSESVEADLYNSSDSLNELLEESLDELEWPIDAVPVTPFRHYRNDDLKYVFEHAIPAHGDSEKTAMTWILGYEATFIELGDVAGEEDED
ncbi:MAG: hypothetical protein CMJ34_11040 [Phycisphaerae bacterium]|nr:hypothetical protein [Phycisphaerae bacterium]